MSTETEYKGYLIKPKTDFGLHGFLVQGRWIKEGFVVTKNNMNMMPGATWFVDVAQAKIAIDVLIECGGNPNEPFKEVDAKKFWEILQPKLKAKLSDKARLSDVAEGQQASLEEVLANMKDVKGNILQLIYARKQMDTMLEIAIDALQKVAMSNDLCTSSTAAVRALLKMQKLGDPNCLRPEAQEPEIDDTVRFCPECETPNQFGELCERCKQGD